MSSISYDTILYYLPTVAIGLLALVVMALVWRLMRSRQRCRQLDRLVTTLQEEQQHDREVLDQYKQELNKRIAEEHKVKEMEERLYREHVLEEEEGIHTGAKLTDSMLMERMEKLTDRNISNTEYTADTMAQVFGLSRTQLDRRMKRMIGKSAVTYILDRRMEKARELLLTTECSIAAIASACGYEDTSYFTRVYKQYYDSTPTQTRRMEG